ncbi:RagB/SusD family nutrient uptake outer membrane protein [Robertkochia sp. 1368]|nr:RagB/SusD family nutrient uptake outer membrane protein [Robertkochia sediminum]
MNRIFKICAYGLASVLMLTSCTKEFLNEPQPTDSVTDVVVFSSREGAEALISGMMRVTRGQFEATDTGGLNSLFFARDVKGNDLIQASSWFRFDYAHDNREPFYRRVRFTWEFPYFMINQANTLINGVNASDLAQEDKDYLLAQGHALRAYYYFQLVMEFQHTYSYDPSLPAPPIYTELSLEGKPMTTVQEMYDLILSDLNTAKAMASDYRLDKSYVNINVINGMLANVHLVMENWAEAEAAANAAYEGFVLNADGYDDGFSDMANPEWIWAMPQTLDQSNYYWGAPHSFTDFNTLSYMATHVNRDFVNLFSDSDVRNIFVEGAVGGNEDNWFYYTTNKFVFAFDSDHPIMRTPEFMLVEAEAKARQGKEAEAHDLLFMVQSDRDPNAVRSANTGEDLIEEILVERRKELYAEIGVEWFDAKRLRRGITRTGNHRVSVDLAPDDKRFFLKVPQSEIDANDSIDDSVNANR